MTPDPDPDPAPAQPAPTPAPAGAPAIDDFARYHRQVLLPGVGAAGQRRLAEGHAIIVGLGALGCVSADLLARAGVGTLTLIDRDTVEFSNLQRQTLYDERDARARVAKAAAAGARLAAVNSGVTLRPLVADVSPRNAEELLAPPGTRPGSVVLVDGSDNFETRYLLNDVSVKHGLPYAYGGVVGTRGMQATFLPSPAGAGACLRCVFPEPPPAGSTPTCDTAGVLGPAVAIVAAAQAADAIKVLLGRPDLLPGTLLEFDLWTNVRRRLEVSRARDAGCVCCGRRSFEFLRGDAASETLLFCGVNAVQITPAAAATVDLPALAGRLAAVGAVQAQTDLVRVGLPDGLEVTVFADARAVVRGTRREDLARSVYARLLGA